MRLNPFCKRTQRRNINLVFGIYQFGIFLSTIWYLLFWYLLFINLVFGIYHFGICYKFGNWYLSFWYLLFINLVLLPCHELESLSCERAQRKTINLAKVQRLIAFLASPASSAKFYFVIRATVPLRLRSTTIIFEHLDIFG